MIILQEIHEDKYNFGCGQAFHAYSDSIHIKGVTDLFKTILDGRIHSINKFPDSRTILLYIELIDDSLTIFNNYTPNNVQNCKDFFFTNCSSLIANNPNENVILCVNFDCQK